MSPKQLTNDGDEQPFITWLYSNKHWLTWMLILHFAFVMHLCTNIGKTGMAALKEYKAKYLNKKQLKRQKQKVEIKEMVVNLLAQERLAQKIEKLPENLEMVIYQDNDEKPS